LTAKGAGLNRQGGYLGKNEEQKQLLHFASNTQLQRLPCAPA
jgi:hypothetical protein